MVGGQNFFLVFTLLHGSLLLKCSMALAVENYLVYRLAVVGVNPFFTVTLWQGVQGAKQGMLNLCYSSHS